MAINTYNQYVSNYLVNSKKPITNVVQKFGRNEDIGTSFEPIAIGGIYRTPQVASATKLRVKAGNAADTAAGNGARKIFIQGLDETGALVSEELTTAGESASANSTNDYLRLFRAYVSESGTYATQSAGSHAAAIVIEDSAGSNDWLTIDVTDYPKGQSEVGVYSIPLGSEAYLVAANIFVDTNKAVDVILFQRQSILQTAAPYEAMREVEYYAGVSGSFDVSPGLPIGPFPELTDIGFMAKASQSSVASVDFELILIDNS